MSLDWRMTISKHGIRDVQSSGDFWVVDGDGPEPEVVSLKPPDVKPPPPPPPPPVGDPLAPRPGEDTSPFVLPPGGPSGISDPSGGDRQVPIGLDPPVKWWFHANHGHVGNPSPQNFKWAGRIADGAMTDYGDHPPADVGAMNLWVLVKDFEDPMTGITIKPPPGYIVRRILKQGHL